MAPCVLWVDEIEKGFPVGEAATTRLLGTLLTWLQEKTAPVFFVATANSVTDLPAELLRRGRFDEIFFVDLPDLEARREVLRVHLHARGRDADDYDTTAVAQVSKSFSGAELEQVVISALHAAFAAGRELRQQDLLDAAQVLVPLYELREAEVKALRAWAKNRARPAGHDRSLVDLFGRS
jgi:SpoVK/Ycf46/Vps4 family AAA+-type ATPase